jgi:hypothetical protein
MRIDLLVHEKWEGLSEDLKALVPVETLENHTFSLRPFRGLAHAVFEIIFGNALYFDHKKNAGIVKGNTYAFTGVLPFLYKNSYEIQSIPYQEMSEPTAWVESLKKDTNFVLFAEDHPVSGELYEWRKLDQLLNEKKIFSIRVSHHSWLAQTTQLGPFSVRICSVSSDYAFAAGGSRFKAPPLISPKMNWQPRDFLAQFEQTKAAFMENQKTVLDFEGKLPQGWQPYLQKTQKRLFDRAIIYNEKYNGEAIQKAILRELGEAGSHVGVESLSFRRWQGLENFEDWWQPTPSLEQIRGLLTIDVRLLKTMDFPMALKKAEAECQI